MENKQATLELGTKPVGKLLIQYALPAMIAMTAASLYNIVDRVFIGQGVGAMAISGLAITFPFMNLTAAFGAGVGVGASTAISVKLGQKDYATAQNILGNTISLNLIIGIGLSIICLLFLDPILRFFGASDQTLIYAHEYMVIILLGNVVSHMYFGMNALLRAASKPRQAMYATIFTVVMNVILDALFIIVFKWGIQGAAIATILSQLMALCWQFKLFSNKSELLHFKKGIYKLKRKLVDNILAIGVSLPDERVRLHHRHLHQQPVGTLRRRPVGGSLRNSQWHRDGVCDVRVRRQPGHAANSRLQLWRAEDRPTDARAEPQHPCSHSHHGDGLADSHVPTLLLRTTVYYRQDADRLGHQGHQSGDGLLPDHRIPDGHHQFLPVHRKGKDQHLPLPVETVAHPPAAPGIPADDMGYRRRMVQYAYLRFLGCSHCRSRDDEIHEQAEENAQGEREVKGVKELKELRS